MFYVNGVWKANLCKISNFLNRTLTVTNADPQANVAQPQQVQVVQPVHHVVSPSVPVAATSAPQAPAAIQTSNPLTRIKFKLSAK